MPAWPKKQSHLSYLEALLEAEVEERDRRAVIRRIKEAHFPAVKTLAEFDFPAAPHIPVALVKKLSEGEYLERKEPGRYRPGDELLAFLQNLRQRL